MGARVGHLHPLRGHQRLSGPVSQSIASLCSLCYLSHRSTIRVLHGFGIRMPLTSKSMAFLWMTSWSTPMTPSGGTWATCEKSRQSSLPRDAHSSCSIRRNHNGGSLEARLVCVRLLRCLSLCCSAVSKLIVKNPASQQRQAFLKSAWLLFDVGSDQLCYSASTLKQVGGTKTAQARLEEVSIYMLAPVRTLPEASPLSIMHVSREGSTMWDI